MFWVTRTLINHLNSVIPRSYPCHYTIFVLVNNIKQNTHAHTRWWIPGPHTHTQANREDAHGWNSEQKRSLIEHSLAVWTRSIKHTHNRKQARAEWAARLGPEERVLEHDGLTFKRSRNFLRFVPRLNQRAYCSSAQYILCRSLPNATKKQYNWVKHQTLSSVSKAGEMPT